MTEGAGQSQSVKTHRMSEGLNPAHWEGGALCAFPSPSPLLLSFKGPGFLAIDSTERARDCQPVSGRAGIQKAASDLASP